MKSMVAILLAGGSSSRMGREKPLLELKGETIVARHLRQLRQIGIEETVLVCNRANQQALRQALGRNAIRSLFVVQEGGDMSTAVRIGLEAAGEAEAAYLICVNDLILDSDYVQIEACGRQGAEIVIPTRTIEQSFTGGRLEWSPRDGQVVGIVEKPDGGCPPGSAANIMVHRIAGVELAKRLSGLMASGAQYEDAVSRLIADGAVAVAVWVNFWIAVKTPADYELACRHIG